MSDPIPPSPAPEEGEGSPSAVSDAAATPTVYEGRVTPLGPELSVTRLLPQPKQRLVGAWCFFDHFGPASVPDGGGMDIGPHPHIGLQTVTWLFEGESLHRDSIGAVQRIRPGQLNLMTSGHGIAHAEHSVEGPDAPRRMHGAQLWVALPEAARHEAPLFDHYGELPILTAEDQPALGGLTVTLLAGSLHGATSPFRAFTPLIGLDIQLPPGAEGEVPLDPGFEHAIATMIGDDVTLPGCGAHRMPTGDLHYLGTGRDRIRLSNASDTEPARLLLIGGEPFEETILMWWNFVARTADEIDEARTQWEDGHERFPAVAEIDQPRIPAPPFDPKLYRRRHGKK